MKIMTLVKWKRPVNGQYANPALYNSPLSGFIENFLGEDILPREHAAFVPAVNLSEEKDKFVIELSAPGFEKDNFKLEVNEKALTISGMHKSEKESAEKNFTRKEFSYGSFQRKFILPEGVNEEAINAKYENGILNISLPKKQEETKSKIEIKIS
jgi:HSP20 family protein